MTNKWRDGIYESNVSDNQLQNMVNKMGDIPTLKKQFPKLKTLKLNSNMSIPGFGSIPASDINLLSDEPYTPSFMRQDPNNPTGYGFQYQTLGDIRNMFGNQLGLNDLETPEFEFGLNMPTFNLVDKGLGTLGNLANTYLGFKNYDLNEDLAYKQMAMADRQYFDNRQDKEKAVGFEADKYNKFLAGYSGPGWEERYAAMPKLHKSSAKDAAS